MIREEKPVLVDFWAPWCSYCRRIGPAYEKIGEEYADSLAVGKINIDEEPQLAGAEGIKVIPVSYTHLDVYKRQIRMTHEQIAQHISSAREAVARMLKSFSEDGLVELKRGAITLRDTGGLNHLK